MSSAEIASIFLPLLFTISIEWLFFFFITREKFLKTIGFVILMNLISWPIATLLYWSWPQYILWIELLVVAMETILISVYWKYNFKKSGVLSLILNSASYFIGIFIFQ